MSHATDLDLIRALVEGRLAAGDRARLEERMASEPALLELFEEYELVHELSAPLLVDAGDASSLRYEDLKLESARPAVPMLRFFRAAAAVLLVAAGAFAAHRVLTSVEPAPVALELYSMQFAAAPTPAAPMAYPEGLEDYRPWFDGEIEWLDSLEEGRLLARFSGRPLLVFSEYPGCPLCIEMGRSTFMAQEIEKLVGQVVPVKLDLTTMDEDQVAYYWERYPYFAIQTVDGDELHPFPGAHDGESLRRNLELGLDRATEIGPRLEWERVEELALLYREGLNAETERRYGAAVKAYGRLVEGGVSDAFFEAGSNGFQRIGREAAAAFHTASEMAVEDPAGARAWLTDTAAFFEGSAHEGDFTAVLEAFSDGRPFPELVEAQR